MEWNTDMMEAAKRLVADPKNVLPMQIPGFPDFFVAVGDDESITGITGFEMNGVSYKIGTLSAK